MNRSGVAVFGVVLALGTAGVQAETPSTQSLEAIVVEGDAGERAERARTRDSVDGRTSRDYNPANAYDSLRLVPGVSFIGDGTRYASPSRIRGSSLWSTADSLAGYPAVRPAGNGTEDGGLNTGLGAIVPSVAIEEIDVAKGGLGVRFGGNADGGVIVTELQRGRAGPPTGEVVYDYSPIREHLVMADVGGGSEDGRWDYYVAGKGLDGDYDEVTTRFGEEQFDQQLNSGLVRTGYELDGGTRLELLGVAGHEEHNWRDVVSDERFRTTNETRYLAVKADHEATGNGWGWRTGYTRYDREAERFNRSTDTVVRDRPQITDTLFADLGREIALAQDLAWSPRVGVEHVDHQQREEAPGAEKDQHFEDTSVYWSNTLAWGDAWTFNAGLRQAWLDSDGGDDDILLYELGAARDFAATGTRVYLSNSTGYYRNKGFVFFASGAFGGDEIPGGLPVAETETTELGLRQELSWAQGGYVKAAVFESTTENAPNFAGLFGTPDPEVNFDTVEVQGLELKAELGLTRNLWLQASYTHLDNEIVDATAAATGRIGDSATSSPEDTAGLGLAWTPTRSVRLSTIATYDSGFRRVDDGPGGVTVTESDSFTRWNAVAEWSPTEALTLGLRVENILDEDDLNFDSRTSGPGGSTTTDSAGETPGRVFAFNLRYRY